MCHSLLLFTYIWNIVLNYDDFLLKKRKKKTFFLQMRYDLSVSEIIKNKQKTSHHTNIKTVFKIKHYKRKAAEIVAMLWY